MILDKNLTLSENQAVTATALSENVIKLPDAGTVYGESGALDRNLGPGTAIPVLIQVVEDFATLTSLTITLETSDNADMSSSTVMASSVAIAAADLVAGYRPSFTRTFPDGVLKDYVAVRYTVGGSNATAGKMTVAIGTEVNT